jgi:hypothetical protein
MLKKLLILPLIGTALLADVTITTTSDGEIEKTYYKDGKMLIISGEGKTIFDTKKGTITVVLDQKKIYLQEPMQHYAQHMKEASQSMQSTIQAQMKEALLARGMSKEQVDMMLKKMQDSMKNPPKMPARPKPVIKKTGSSKVAGYACDTYSVVDMVHQSHEEACVSSEVERLIGKEIDIAAMKAMAQKMKEGDADAFDDPLEDAGFPMRRRDLGYGTPQMIEEVTSVSKKPIDRALFDTPRGYKKMSVKEFYNSMIQAQMH